MSTTVTRWISKDLRDVREHECLSTHRNRAGYRHSGEKHTGLTNKIYILTAEGAEKYLADPGKIGSAFNGAGLAGINCQALCAAG